MKSFSTLGPSAVEYPDRNY